MLIFLVKLSFLAVDDVIKPMTSSISVRRVPHSNFLELTYQTQAWQNGFSNSSLLQLLPQSCQVPSLKELNLVHILVSHSDQVPTNHQPSKHCPYTVQIQNLIFSLLFIHHWFCLSSCFSLGMVQRMVE